MRVGLAFIGLGGVGRAVFGLLHELAPRIEQEHGIALLPTLLADSTASALCEGWHDAAEAVLAKGAGVPIRSSGAPLVALSALLRSDTPVVALDATAPDYSNPRATTDLLCSLLGMATCVVTANKAPLATGWDQVMNAATRGSSHPLRHRLGFTAATGLTFPAVSQVVEGCCAGRLVGLAGVLNGTTAHILSAMESDGLGFDEALSRAQSAGIAEPDSSLDVDGWDSAAKITILASALTGSAHYLSDVARSGISGVTRQQMLDARAGGRALRLVARAEADPSDHRASMRLSVAPEALPAGHPLARLGPGGKGLVVETDLFGEACLSGGRSGLRTTAAVMVRDMLQLLTRGQGE